MEESVGILARAIGQAPTSLGTAHKLRARAYTERFTVRAKDIEGLRQVAKEHKTFLNVLYRSLCSSARQNWWAYFSQ